MLGPEWAGVLVGAVAAVGTVGALMTSLAVLRRQTDLQRRQQASQVSLHLTEDPLAAVVHNASGLPIYSIVVLGDPLTSASSTSLFARTPHFLTDTSTEILLPGATASLQIKPLFERAFSSEGVLATPELVWPSRSLGLSHIRGGLLTPELHFTDALGNRWRRTARGVLDERPELGTVRDRWRRLGAGRLRRVAGR